MGKDLGKLLKEIIESFYFVFAFLFPLTLTRWLSISGWFALPLILFLSFLWAPREFYRRFRSAVLDLFDDLVLGRTRDVRRKCIRAEMRRGFRELFELVNRYREGEVGVNWFLMRLEQIREVIGRDRHD